MNQNDFKYIGDEIKEIVQNAIDSEDFSQLNRTIKGGLEKATDAVEYGMKTAEKTVTDTIGSYQIRKNKNEVALYRRMNGLKMGTMLYTVFSYIFGGAFGVSIFVLAMIMIALGGISFGLFLSAAILLPFCVLFFGVGIKGSLNLSMMKRFERYIEYLHGKTYGELTEFASLSGKTLSYIRDDLQRMIQKGWFLQGHLDDEKTCLITSDDTYRDYLKLKEQNAIRIQEAEMRREKGISPEAESLIEEGRAFVETIHECNEAIPDEGISEKIASIEEIIDKIFDYIETYPIRIEKVKKLMDYYLPTTVKLLKAYEELDKQPVQGENIISAKKEIEDSLDVLCKAYKKKLDDLFQEQAWDVSSDISVLKTMLAQDGLAEKDF
ncbi:MAG: 5-bromo-4-chloroindolyl phosphate hydrolysis family protein [Lachnospiraceae bacterium]|nr:5-bromo-4-chloroindolyl phosphate hydrolysis family protein [Lachnospiraceae bacterium]